MEPATILKLAHLMGLVLGFGGALLADFTVLSQAVLRPVSQPLIVDGGPRPYTILLVGVTTLFMVFVFGAIPFTDALIVRYVDNSMRSRVSGVRLAISFGVSSVAVYLLCPVVKAKGFETLLYAMAIIGLITLTLVNFLPSDTNRSPLKGAPAPT